MPENKHLRFFVILLYCLLGALAIWLIFKYALGLFAPFIIAFLVAMLIEKPVTFFTKTLKIPRALSSGLWTVIAFGGVGSLLYLLVSKLVREAYAFFKSLPEPETIIDNFTSSLGNLFSFLPDGISSWFGQSVDNLLSGDFSLPNGLLSSVGSVTASAAGSVPTILLTTIIVLAATYFFSADYHNLRASISKMMPDKWRKLYRKMKSHSIKTLGKYIRALGILMCITFVELSIGFSILGFDYALVIAFFTALIDALPVFGVGGVLIPLAIYNLITRNFFLAAGLAILYGVIVVVRNVLEPKIVGVQIGLHPIITLLSVYIGLRVFGILGIFTPIFVVLGRQLYLCFKKDEEPQE